MFDSGSVLLSFYNCLAVSLWFMLLLKLSDSSSIFEVISPKALRETKLTLLFEARLLGLALLDPLDEIEFLLIPRLLFNFTCFTDNDWVYLLIVVGIHKWFSFFESSIDTGMFSWLLLFWLSIFNNDVSIYIN